jgi:hypothetical protein
VEYRALFGYKFKEFVQPLAVWKEETRCVSEKKKTKVYSIYLHYIGWNTRTNGSLSCNFEVTRIGKYEG